MTSELTRPPPGGTSNPDAIRRQVLERIKGFPSMPVFVSNIIALLNNPNANVSQIADTVKFDPGMTANILRLANSAEFGAHQRIHSLKEAIVRLGLKQLFQMVVAFGMADKLACPLTGFDLQPDELLSHSLWTALASEELCKKLNMAMPDMLFTAGILHDLGKLLIDDFVAAREADIRQIVQAQNLSFEEAESRVLGIHHAETGAEVLDRWHFPIPLVAVARWHHRPEAAGEFRSIASIVHIADALSYAEGIGSGVDGFSYKLSDSAIAHLGLKTKTLEYVASQTLDKMRELQDLLRQQGG